jgi:hypothetical protein
VEDDDKKPVAVSMKDVFYHDLTQVSIPDNRYVPQSALEVALSSTENTGNVDQSTTSTNGNLAQSISSFTQSTTSTTGNAAQSTSTFAQSNTQLDAALANNALTCDGISLSPQVIQILCPVLYLIFYVSKNSPS